MDRMIGLNLTGSVEELVDRLDALYPGTRKQVKHVWQNVFHHPDHEISFHEAMLLHILTRQYNKPGAQILEIGTCYGYSASIMADAAPKANIVTMTPNWHHVKFALENFKERPNIQVVQSRSVDYLYNYSGPMVDILMVDGDHNEIRADLPWWNWVKVGGLMFHHDYSNIPERPPCRKVYGVMNEFSKAIHKPDILMVTDKKQGVAGWYRNKGEVWHTQPPQN